MKKSKGSKKVERESEKSDLLNRSSEQREAGIFGTSKADVLKSIDSITEQLKEIQHDIKVAEREFKDGRRSECLTSLHFTIPLACDIMLQNFSDLRAQVMTIPTLWSKLGE